MERQFPKNVKQMGNVSDTPKIYVEDYVDTYVNQIKEKTEAEELVIVFLLGEILTIQEQECVFVTGAVRINEVDTNLQDLKVGVEHLEIAKRQSYESFDGREVVGWMIVTNESAREYHRRIRQVHERLFSKKNTLFILETEEEEVYYTYKFHDLMEIGGHYVFYEKNPNMQNYMVSQRRSIGVTPSEYVEDRAAKDFRDTIRGRMEIRERRKESRHVYLTSALLIIVVLAIGISTMNNYDKIAAVQNSIETLSTRLGKKEEAVAKEDGKKEEAKEETEKNQGMEPITSTIQEELNDGNYYIVKKGDTLDTISRKLYGNTKEIDAICRMNGLRDGNLIFIGQKLLLP